MTFIKLRATEQRPALVCVVDSSAGHADHGITSPQRLAHGQVLFLFVSGAKNTHSVIVAPRTFQCISPRCCTSCIQYVRRGPALPCSGKIIELEKTSFLSLTLPCVCLRNCFLWIWVALQQYYDLPSPETRVQRVCCPVYLRNFFLRVRPIAVQYVLGILCLRTWHLFTCVLHSYGSFE